MKQYQQLDEHGDVFKIGTSSIPAAPGNVEYIRMLEEIEAGTSEKLRYVAPPPAPARIALDDLIDELEKSDPLIRGKLQAKADAR